MSRTLLLLLYHEVLLKTNEPMTSELLNQYYPEQLIQPSSMVQTGPSIISSATWF